MIVLDGFGSFWKIKLYRKMDILKTRKKENAHAATLPQKVSTSSHVSWSLAAASIHSQPRRVRCFFGAGLADFWRHIWAESQWHVEKNICGYAKTPQQDKETRWNKRVKHFFQGPLSYSHYAPSNSPLEWLMAPNALHLNAPRVPVSLYLHASTIPAVSSEQRWLSEYVLLCKV